MAVLAGGHACVDGAQGAVPALIPFMVAAHDLSAAQAGALVMAATISSTIVQPVFGAYSDRTDAPWLLPAGVVCGCAGVAAAGVVPSYALALVAILISGLGVAAYHPEGSRYANYVSGGKRATGMSYYSLGGNVGFALGPLFVTPMLIAFGLSGALAMLVPGIAIGSLLATEQRRLHSFRPPRPAPGSASRRTEGDSWGGFITLIAVICARSFAYYTLLALIPLFFIDALGTSDATANGALTAMLVAGAVGTLVGGRLADRIGRRPVLIASLALQPPLLLGITVVGTVPAIVLVAALGFVAISSFGVTVVMSQEYLPSRLGVAAGFSLGAAIGVGGVAAPAFGLIGDRMGLDAAVQALAVLPALGALLALALPPAAQPRGRLAATTADEARAS